MPFGFRAAVAHRREIRMLARVSNTSALTGSVNSEAVDGHLI